MQLRDLPAPCPRAVLILVGALHLYELIVALDLLAIISVVPIEGMRALPRHFFVHHDNCQFRIGWHPHWSLELDRAYLILHYRFGERAHCLGYHFIVIHHHIIFDIHVG